MFERLLSSRDLKELEGVDGLYHLSQASISPPLFSTSCGKMRGFTEPFDHRLSSLRQQLGNQTGRLRINPIFLPRATTTTGPTWNVFTCQVGAHSAWHKPEQKLSLQGLAKASKELFQSSSPQLLPALLFCVVWQRSQQAHATRNIGAVREGGRFL